MRKTIIAGAIAVVLAVLIVGLAIPALAHSGPAGGQTQPPNEEVWEGMYEACLNGDWEGMLEAMEEIHGQSFTGMPCFGTANTGPDGESQTPGPGWDGSGGRTGGGTTGGWGGMMGGGYSYGGHMGGGMMGW